MSKKMERTSGWVSVVLHNKAYLKVGEKHYGWLCFYSKGEAREQLKRDYVRMQHLNGLFFQMLQLNKARIITAAIVWVPTEELKIKRMEFWLGVSS